MSFFLPCIKASGPSPCKIAFVGEAPGEQEELTGLPFVGYSGAELTSMLQDVGIERKDCYLTNVLFTRPPGNKIDAFCVKKAETAPGSSPPFTTPLSSGHYLHSSLRPELDRLYSSLTEAKPNVTVALGNLALWALGHSDGKAPKISQARGVVQYSPRVPLLKLLPTYHPAAVLRNWSWRVVVLQDLLKAKREAEFPEIRRVERRIIVDPDWTEVRDFCSSAAEASILSCDIETERRQITSIAFSTSEAKALTIPFWNKTKSGYHHWSEANEILILDYIHRLLSRHPRVLFQNGLYDLQYIWRTWGCPVPGFIDDTMLLHHSLYPELPKSLGFLGSIYTNEISWKQMRDRFGSQETKREE